MLAGPARFEPYLKSVPRSSPTRRSSPLRQPAERVACVARADTKPTVRRAGRGVDLCASRTPALRRGRLRTVEYVETDASRPAHRLGADLDEYRPLGACSSNKSVQRALVASALDRCARWNVALDRTVIFVPEWQASRRPDGCHQCGSDSACRHVGAACGTSPARLNRARFVGADLSGDRAARVAAVHR